MPSVNADPRVVSVASGNLPTPANILTQEDLDSSEYLISARDYALFPYHVADVISLTDSTTLKWFPIKLRSNFDFIATTDAFDDNRVRLSILHLRDPDRNTLNEEIISRDKVPIIGLNTFNGTPLTHDQEPWFFVHMGFIDQPVSLLMTYGDDVVVRRQSSELMNFQGRIVDPFSIEKSAGEELYGSIVFPSVSFSVHNNDGVLNFLTLNPEHAYGAYCQIWRWDPVNRVMIDEFTGTATAFDFGEQTINFSFSPIERAFMEVQIPQNISRDMDSYYNNAQNPGQPLGKFYGRNLNVPCPNIVSQDGLSGDTPLYEYWAGWGHNVITGVRRDGEGVSIYPIDTNTSEYAVTVNYEPYYTKLSFYERQTTGDGSPYTITADIEGCETPRRNLLTYTEGSYANTVAWSTWTNVSSPNNVYNRVDNVAYNVDGRKTAAFFDAYDQYTNYNSGVNAVLQQVATLDNTVPGLMGYWILKTPSAAEVQEIVRGGYGVYEIGNWVYDQGTEAASISACYPAIKLTHSSSYYGYDYAGMYSGSVNLVDNWMLYWICWTTWVNPGLVGLSMTSKRDWPYPWLVGGSYLAGINTFGVSGGVPLDFGRHPYQAVSSPGYGSTRNFAMNIYDLMINGDYGFNQYSVDLESFERAGWELFVKGIYCDGPLNVNKDGKSYLDQLLQPMNMRLERKTAFRTWYLYTDDNDGDVSSHSFGYGDDEGLNNIVSSESIQARASEDFPKQLLFRSGMLRDEQGNDREHKRVQKIRNLDREYGRIVDMSNEFIRYERSADIMKEFTWNKLSSGVLSVSFATTEKTAWNLELDDIITLYCPSKGIDALELEITGIIKGFDVVTISARKASDCYSYTGTAPKDRDFDNTYFESERSGYNTGATGTASKTVDIPGGKPSDPSAGSFKVFGRVASSSDGQELCVLFQDGTVRVLARSVNGSPGYLNSIPIVEDLTMYAQSYFGDDWVQEGWATSADIVAKLSKPAIVNSLLEPVVYINGVRQPLTLVTGTNPSTWGATEFGQCKFRTYDQTILLNAENEDIAVGNVIKVQYHTPIDYSAHILTGYEQITLSQGPNRVLIHKDMGKTWDGTTDYLRGIFVPGTSEYTPEYARMAGVRVYNNSYYLFLNRAHLSTGDDYITVLQYDKYGHWEYAHRTPCTYPAYTPWPTLTEQLDPCFDIDSAGNVWVALTDDTGNSYLMKLSTDLDTIGDANRVVITNAVGGVAQQITAFAIRRLGVGEEEFHIFLKNKERVVLDSSYQKVTEASVLKVQQGYVNEAQYSDEDDNFYVTLVNGDGKQPAGWQILGPSGQEISNLCKPDNDDVSLNIFKSDGDGYCYITYANSLGGVSNLYLAQIHKDAMIQYGMASRFNVKSVATNYTNVSSLYTTRVFAGVIEASEMSFSQIV
jgi:hypothetical protein